MRRLALLVMLLTAPTLAQAEIMAEDAFSPDHGATSLVVKTVQSARHDICVAAYLLTSYPVANALIRAHQKGVAVKVVMDREQSNWAEGSLAGYLAGNGVPVRLNGNYDNMHDKFMVIDADTVELGSFNYTRTAEHKNAENVLVLRQAPAIAADYRRQCEILWGEGRDAASDKH